MYIEFNIENHDMVGKGRGGAIEVQVGVSDGVAHVLQHKIIRRVKTKRFQNNVLHFGIYCDLITDWIE